MKRQKYPQHQNVRSEGTSLRLKKKVEPKSYTQELYMESLEDSAVTFGTGPAGTGKTYMAVYVALQKLVDKEINRIVITRPVVEAGERLGFLPGTLEEKVHPYLLPILDSVKDLVGPQMAEKLLESGALEIAPLAFMRGRTFNDAYMILDEAQNADYTQLKLFLTRVGFNTQVVVSGDIEQTDLADRSGLAEVIKRTRGRSEKVQVIEFSQADCVRSNICALFTKLL